MSHPCEGSDSPRRPRFELLRHEVEEFLRQVMRGRIEVWNDRPVVLDDRIAAARLMIEVSLRDVQYSEGVGLVLRACPVVVMELPGRVRVSVVALPSGEAAVQGERASEGAN